MIADCLDAALAAHWGPDDLDVRRSLADQLDEVAAHVLNPNTRLQAHLWGLQVACEALDIPTMHRQIRALELLGEESPRALFFAASRRLMLDLLRGRFDTTRRLIDIATEAAEQASLADAWMVLKAMEFYSAAQSGDTVPVRPVPNRWRRSRWPKERPPSAPKPRSCGRVPGEVTAPSCWWTHSTVASSTNCPAMSTGC